MLIPPQSGYYDSAPDDEIGSNVIFDPLHNSGCDFDVQKNSELAKFSGILEFMGRVPIQKALTDQRPLYKSHIKRFWKH
ncbi:hypothetical protein Hanom_Chr14g01261611 [Helianthus anomalus]